MSTRATYQFETRMGQKLTFYIHHDGYPQGAAVYFSNALNMNKAITRRSHTKTKQQRTAEVAARFFRANLRAEFTTGHDAHGDTEYQYNVTPDGQITAVSCASWRERKEVFSGSIEDFVELKNLGPDCYLN